MKNLFKLLCLIAIVLSAISCDNEVLELRQSFTINSDLKVGGNGQILLYLTNQRGEILLDTVGNTLEGVLEIEKMIEDQVNLTVGTSDEHAFNFYTYRDIPSGFNLIEPWVISAWNCGTAFDINNEGKVVKLKIEGLSEFAKVYYPSWTTANTFVDEVNNTVTIAGPVTKTSDVLITILPEEGGTHLSKVFDLSVYEVVNQTVEITTNLDDFEESIIEEISLGINDTWRANIEFVTKEDRVVQVWKHSLNNNDDYFKGDKIRFFTTKDLQVEQVQLEIASEDYNYWYRKIVEEVPDAITFYDPEIETVNAETNSFEFFVGEQYDLQLFRYNYRRDNHGSSSWTILQLPDIEDLGFQLPAPPLDYLKEYDYIEELLLNPSHLRAAYFKIENEEINTTYNEASIGGRLACLDYLHKHKIVEF